MIGTAPVFYRIVIDQNLAHNIDRPGQSLTVKKLVPPVADLGRYMVDGMVPLENRQVVFRCLNQFRKFVSDGDFTYTDEYRDMVLNSDFFEFFGDDDY